MGNKDGQRLWYPWSSFTHRNARSVDRPVSSRGASSAAPWPTLTGQPAETHDRHCPTDHKSIHRINGILQSVHRPGPIFQSAHTERGTRTIRERRDLRISTASQQTPPNFTVKPSAVINTYITHSTGSSPPVTNTAAAALI